MVRKTKKPHKHNPDRTQDTVTSSVSQENVVLTPKTASTNSRDFIAHVNEQKKTSSTSPVPQSQSQDKSAERPSPLKYEPILTRSTPVDEDSLDSFGEKSSESEELDVIFAAEDDQYETKVAIGKLSRIGFRQSMWSNKFGSLFVMLTFLISFDSLMRFAIQCDQKGAWFALAYFFSMVFLGFPLMYLEMALGQYTSSSAVAVFSKIAPGFTGVGIASVLYNFVTMFTDQVFIVQFFHLFKSSSNFLTNEMPWQRCTGSHNDENCYDYEDRCLSLNNPTPKVGFRKTPSYIPTRGYSSYGDSCVHHDDKLHVIGHDNPNLANYIEWISSVSLEQSLFHHMDFTNFFLPEYPRFFDCFWIFCGWACVFAFVQMSRGKIVKMATVTIILLSVLIAFFIAIFMFHAPPDYPRINVLHTNQGIQNAPEILASAVLQTLHILKLGQGVLIFIGSQNTFHNNILNDAFAILVVMLFLPFLFACVYLFSRDSFFLEIQQGSVERFAELLHSAIKVYSVTSNIPSIHLTTFIMSMKIYKHFETFLICTFTFVGVLLLLSNRVVQLEILVSTITESTEIFANYYGRKLLISTIIGSAGIMMFYLYGENSLEVLSGFTNIVHPTLACIIVLSQLFVVIALYGPNRILANITAMRRTTLHGHNERFIYKLFDAIMIVSWGLGAPVLIIFSLIYTQVDVIVQDWTFPFAVCLIVLLVIPIHLIRKVRERYDKSYTIMVLFRSDPDLWGPRSKVDQIFAEKVEKQFRSTV